jgi:hypothetical protein
MSEAPAPVVVKQARSGLIEACQWNPLTGLPRPVPAWITEALNKFGTPDDTVGALMRCGNEVHIGAEGGQVIRAQPGWWLCHDAEHGRLFALPDSVMRLLYSDKQVV